MEKKPLIIAFINDLYFSMRVESAAQALGFQTEVIEQASDIIAQGVSLIETAQRQLGEHLEGPGAQVLDWVTRQSPALLIFDLNNQAVPWGQWLSLIKSVSATRRIPVIAFGSHMDVKTMQAARASGADAVLARSRFLGELPTLIQKYAHIPDYPAIQASCKESLSPTALAGLHLFNQGEYFEAHEVLEEAWNGDQSPAQELYRAILQIAVAYLQIERGNYRGAVKMFLRVRQWLEPLPEVCRSVNVAQLRRDAAAVEAALIASGEAGIAGYDRSLFAPVQFIASGDGS